MNIPARKIWIVTGPRGVGKTRFCTHLVEEARRNGIKIAGLICPPAFHEKEKKAIHIEDLASGVKGILARVRTAETDQLHTDHWVFDPKMMTWGNDVLGAIQSCDLLVIDELGPLEFLRGQGWQNGLKVIENGFFNICVVVIRPELVDEACSRWPSARLLEIPAGLDEKNEAELIKTILF
mgnify:CR=1 FL=1